MSIHHAYVQNLISKQPVKIGGSVVQFQPMSGEGWFGDKVKGLWGQAKDYFHEKVKPVLTGQWDKHKDMIMDKAKDIGKTAFKNALDTKGSLKDQVMAG